MFGHAAGAYTSAREQRDGLAQAAEHGTLFLDELDALASASQAKLLRFVQNKEYRRVGEHQLRHVDVRFVAATNADLAVAVRDGRFREDLFFRLRVVPITIPPLRDRRDDIGPLLERFAEITLHKKYRLRRIALAESARLRLEAYEWPGNIREFENCVRYLTCIQLARPIEAEDLPLLGPPPAAAAPATFGQAKRESLTLRA